MATLLQPKSPSKNVGSFSGEEIQALKRDGKLLLTKSLEVKLSGGRTFKDYTVGPPVELAHVLAVPKRDFVCKGVLCLHPCGLLITL